ncbi:MAG: HAD family hydrolase [Akkermansiaceae bacterium]|nr:HAD family hydrolase [Armatimonadota bacterium]
MRKIDAVLFDLDGTLVRTFIDFPAMRREVCERARDIYYAGDTILQNNDSLDVIHQTLAALPSEQREEARRDLYAVLERHEEVGCERPEAIPGATDLLRSLYSQSVRVAVVTRNARRIADSLCRRMNLAADVVVAREDTSTYKPHPEPLQVACSHLNVHPKRTVMIGDLWADIAAGIAAGCAITIGIQWAHDPPDRFGRAAPTHIVATLKDAGDILLAMTR